MVQYCIVSFSHSPLYFVVNFLNKVLKNKNLKKYFLRTSAVLSLVLGIIWFSVPQADAAFAGTWQFPLKGDWDISYPFGAYYGGTYHLADDVLGDAGDPVYAPANGKIVRIENWTSCQNYGGLVLMEVTNYDGSKFVALHGHLNGDNVPVTVGQEVSRGQIIGYLGNSSQNGCWVEHIHFGINKGPYVESPWKYYGYGDADALDDWEDPAAYIGVKSKFVEVSRVPSNSHDRYETAAGVSKRQFKSSQSVDNVLLASGQVHVDGLAAAPLTKHLDGPLLLTKKETIPASTEAEIKRVLKDGGKVVILGGTATITEAVGAKIKSWGFTTKRAAGKNREETATKAAAYTPNADTVFITNRNTFPDSVSAGGPGTVNQYPILLTKPDDLSKTTRDYIRNHPRIKNVVIVGGTASIENKVADQLKELKTVDKVERVWGHDRYETNAKLNTKYLNNIEKIIVATGQDYPDALGGGSLSSTENAALVLSKKDEIPQSLIDYVEPKKADFSESLILGGQAALSESVRVGLVNILNSPITGSVAGSSEAAQDIQLAPADWSATRSENISSLSVPLATNYQAKTENFRGAEVILTERGDEGGEEFSPLLISKLPYSGDKIPQDILADWFGMDPTLFDEEFIKNELVFLKTLPSWVPTSTAVVVTDDEIILIESRLLDLVKDKELIERVYSLNFSH